MVCWAWFHAVSVHCKQCHSDLAPLLLQFEGQTVLIGVDDMDVFKGIELKLQAVERVLDHHPEWRGRLTLVQVTNAPRSASWHLPACGRSVHLSSLHSWPMRVLCVWMSGARFRCSGRPAQFLKGPGCISRGP